MCEQLEQGLPPASLHAPEADTGQVEKASTPVEPALVGWGCGKENSQSEGMALWWGFRGEEGRLA